MPTDKWYVYLLFCRDYSLYCGITKDLERRLEQHNQGIGAKYTRSRLPVRLVWSLEVIGQSAALRIEAGIKKLSRKNKLKLIGI